MPIYYIRFLGRWQVFPTYFSPARGFSYREVDRLTLYGIQDVPPPVLLSYALERELGLTFLPKIARTDRGKPYFPDRPALHFSWSHSGPYVLCALSDRPVGADIEVIRPRRSDLPYYALTEPERREYFSLGGDWPAFYTMWTRREAWCKYTGVGLRAQWGQTPQTEGLRCASYAGADWRASVCGEEAPPEGILWVKREDLL